MPGGLALREHRGHALNGASARQGFHRFPGEGHVLPVTVAVICWEPMLEMLSVMPVVALWVMETRITTAMTPMMMPSMVRKERICG